MPLLWFVLAAGLSFISVRLPGSSGTADSPIAIVGATVLTMDDGVVLTNHTVLVRDGRIERLAPTADVDIPEDAQPVDGRGRFVMPGLMDMHVHTFERSDMALFLYNGVTTVRNLHGIPLHLAWRDSIDAGLLRGPRIVTSGPILDGDPPFRPTNRVITDPEDAIVEIDRQHEAGYDFLKLYDNMSPVVYETLVARARELGMPVAGHIPTPVGLDRMLELNGQTVVEHVEEIAAFFDDGADTTGVARTIDRMVRNGQWLDPTMTVWMWPYRQTDAEIMARPEHAYVSPAMKAAFNWASEPSVWTNPEWHETIERRRRFAHSFVADFHAAGGRLLAGSDVPLPTLVPGFALHEELQALHEAGIPAEDVLTIATRNGGSLLGIEAGRVREGYIADLILLDEDPRRSLVHLRKIVGVVVGGRWQTADELEAALTRYN